MNNWLSLVSLGLFLSLAMACQPQSSSESTRTENVSPNTTNIQPAVAIPTNSTAPMNTTNEVAVIKTYAGEMVIGFWPDVAPNTVENFKKLARQGFYDGIAFHRVVDGFMIQGGDPLSKTDDPDVGTGGPGYQIKAEFNNRPHERGVISMARSQDINSAGSQFFICLARNASTAGLDGKYTAFGKLLKGDDVLEKIGKTPVQSNGRGETSRPTTRQAIESIKMVPENSIK
jgi:peptidyl-prolyl cis-trans isomerase B (cyclophilin B)